MTAQVLRVCISSTVRWFSYIPLWKKSSFVFIKPQIRTRVQKFCAIGSVHAKAQSSSVFAPIQLV